MSTQERLTAALADHYRIERELGAGGMATVYLAHDLKHERDVAIKVLHPDLGAALGADRFLAEIKTTAKLQHPHILPLLDSGNADGLLWYAMPYVEGETLRGRLERETQLPIAEAVRLAREVADALQAAHARGVIHRDIKPENILLQGGPGTAHALVADFGIALAVQSAAGARMTQTGLSLGTPQYMSPEQATGEKVIDARSDIYALGAVTYEMLVGEPPFTGPSTQAIVARLLSTPPPSLTATRNTIPPHVEAAVLTALAKLPADRQASVGEFAAQLTGAVPMPFTHATEVRRNTGAASGANDDPRRTVRALRRTRAMLGATTALALGALAAVAWITTRPAPATPVRVFPLALPDSTQLYTLTATRRVAISRDGRQVFFAGGSTTRGRSALFVRELADTILRRIPGTEGGSGPVLCPDGKWLYYTFQTRTWRVPPQGGQPTLVADSATVTDCNDAGDLLVTRTGRLLLWRAGQRPREVAAPDSARGEGSYGGGTFLPGGTHVVFSVLHVGQTLGSSTLATAPLSGGAAMPLAVTGVRPKWSLGHLLFVRDGNLVAAPFDPKSRTLRGEPLPLVSDVATRGNDYDVSDDGTLVYASGAVVGGYRLTRVDRAGREELLDRAPAAYSWPRVSPDGKRIAV